MLLGPAGGLLGSIRGPFQDPGRARPVRRKRQPPMELSYGGVVCLMSVGLDLDIE